MATVLVVDDDDGVRQIVAAILKADGHSVLWAGNGIEALMVYSSYRSRFDLVLTDIDMPQMNGIELVGRIRALDPSRRILVMTGGGNTLEGLEDCPVISKPFKPDQLRTAVKRLLTA